MVQRQLPILLAAILMAFTPRLVSAADCNGNGIEDSCDISCSNPGCNEIQGCGQRPDCNNNGVPDECDIQSLYLGTKGGDAGVGRVYVYNGGSNWIDISPEPAWNVAAVMDLAFYNGKLYAATQSQHGRGGGSGVGEVWQYDGNRVWTRIAPNMDNSAIVLEVFKDQNGSPALFVATNTMSLKYCSVCDGSDWAPAGQGSSGTGFRSGYVASAVFVEQLSCSWGN